MRATPEQSAADARALDLLMPIQFFYLRSDRIVPEVEFIAGEEMPEPCRGLLVHESDMTPRLGAFHESAIGLTVLESEHANDYLMRAVLLTDAAGRPVEFGAIGIRLEVFSEPLRKAVVEGKEPLGGLLGQHRFPHSSKPKAYFRVKADEFIAANLRCEPGSVLYGRCNALFADDGLAFADIVEILPAPDHG